MKQDDYQSRCITSNQEGLHPHLTNIVRRHLDHPFRKPIAAHTKAAFDHIKDQIEAALQNSTPLIFDSCCGTAVSTRLIAKKYPDALVIGIDRSIKRLSKEYEDLIPDNARLVQAECGDFWRLAVEAGWKLDKHFILYPNPYPKSKHIQRRWHAHPAYPSLIALGGRIELRSNWKIYVDEFCAAYTLAKPSETAQTEAFEPDEYFTLFERKYHQSGQRIYRCILS